MNKKGGHVDWVISMGIFIIYIFALFILIRPGVKPVYRPTDLLNNLQQNFEEDVIWTVKTVPLFVRICRPGAESASVDVNIPDSDWRISRAILNNNPGNAVNFPLNCEGEGYSNDIVTIFISQSGLYDPQDYLNLEEECFFNELTGGACEAELGVVEDIKGLNQNSLDGLTSDITQSDVDIYKNLKASWGVPEEKDFSISIDREVNGQIENIIGAKPGEQANVFVRRFESQIVTSIGETTPTAVYLRIW